MSATTTTTTRTTIDICADGVWAGNGHVTVDSRGCHSVVCAADLGEGAYEAIEDAIDNGDESCEHDGVSYSWSIETA